MRKISLNEKLIVFFMLLGTGAIGIIGMFSYYSARDALMDRTFNQLISVRTVRKKQIEAFFADRIRDVELMACAEEAKHLLQIANHADGTRKNEGHLYKDNFDRYLIQYLSNCGYYTGLQVTGSGGNGLALAIPPTDTSYVLQIQQAENQPATHVFDSVKTQTGGILYDYTETSGRGLLVAANIAGSEGIIILKISPESINKIMLESSPEDGLGASGESYLVGRDRLFRSDSRFSKGGVLKLKTSSPAALMAVAGNTGTTECTDYRGIGVLSAFTQLKVPGLDWIILAEIDKNEALIPVDRLRLTILVFTLLTGTVFFVLTFLFAHRITRPLIKLTKAATRVGSGNLDILVEIDNNDEIGELAESFNFMMAKLKMQNEQLNAERVGRLSSVIDGQEIERQRFSREMHDSVGQALSAIRLRLELATHADDQKRKMVVDQTKTLVDRTIDEVRAICRSLTPPALSEFGPITAIRRLAEDAAQHAGLKLHFNVTGALSNPGVKPGTYLYRIAQEAINNVIKHAEAGILEIDIIIEEQFLNFSCKDDGKGFDPQLSPSGNGILNMKERALLIDGSFCLTSAPMKGTQITVKIPFSKYGTDQNHPG